MVTVLTTLLTVGVFADGWSHIRFGADQSVLSVYHLTFNASAVLLTVLIVGVTLLRRRAGLALRAAVPRGHGPTMVGVAMFLVAGAADLAGHALFGFEVGLEALVSPTHLPLFVAWFLIVTAPLRSVEPDGVAPWTVVISSALAVSAVAFATQAFVAIGGIDWALAESRFDQPVIGEVLGVGSVLYQSALLAGVIIWLAKRYSMPAGGWLVLFVVHGALMASLRWSWWQLVPIVAAGLVAEFVVRIDRRPLLTVPAAAVATLWGVYLGTAALADIGGGVGWSGYIATGSVFQGAAVAALLGLVAERVSP